MTRADDALQRLYEDTGWREDLIDSEANALLKWAENKLLAFDAQSTDAIDFETRVNTIRRVMVQIDKLVARQARMTPEERQSMLDSLAALMHVTPLQQDDLLKHGFSAQTVSDNTPMIGALTAWLDGGDLPWYDVPEQPAQWGGIIHVAAAAEAPPAPDPAAMSAILDFFNTTPTDPPPNPEDTPTDDADAP
jgi:hypothetical protein